MVRALALCSAMAFVLASPAASAGGLAPIPKKPPPASDGSSGSFDGQFGAGTDLVWFNTDTGQVWSEASGGYVAFTVPYKVATWNNQTFNAYNFTDITVEPTVALTIYGSEPAMFLASQNVSFSGQFTIAAAAGAGGAAPNPNDPPYDGGTGTSADGRAGGLGGDGASGQVEGAGCSEGYTGGGGGGGGNVGAGGKGLRGDYPVDGPPPPIHNPGGKAGSAEKTTVLQGGGGGGAGGGGYLNGNFWGWPGANGGGAVVIAANSGSIDIAAGASITASGATGSANGEDTGKSGGGAGGDEWFYAGGSFTNDGTLSASGGPGGTSTYVSGCVKPKKIKGPDGGDGAGGNVAVQSADIANRGVITVSAGGDAADEGSVVYVGHVTQAGHVVGAQPVTYPRE
jgi:hypothetical protein